MFDLNTCSPEEQAEYDAWSSTLKEIEMDTKPSDKEMYDKGYRYRCDLVDPVASPYVSLYAKDLKMVSIIHRDWPTQRFNVVKLELPEQVNSR